VRSKDEKKKGRKDEEHEIPVEDGSETGEGSIEGSGKASSRGKGTPPPDSSGEGLEKELEELSQELDTVRAELEDTKDQFLRGLADFDNYRKRVVREREQLTRCANEELIKRLLEVIDNIERALSAASETHDLEGFKQGIELIDQHLKDLLTKEGLCPIECLGHDFDPNYHEAVMAIDKEDVESEKVVEEIQKGYMLDGRVIRPSKVVVSK
jgi:molecular chaperone GrpE